MWLNKITYLLTYLLKVCHILSSPVLLRKLEISRFEKKDHHATRFYTTDSFFRVFSKNILPAKLHCKCFTLNAETVIFTEGG